MSQQACHFSRKVKTSISQDKINAKILTENSMAPSDKRKATVSRSCNEPVIRRKLAAVTPNSPSFHSSSMVHPVAELTSASPLTYDNDLSAGEVNGEMLQHYRAPPRVQISGVVKEIPPAQTTASDLNLEDSLVRGPSPENYYPLNSFGPSILASPTVEQPILNNPTGVGSKETSYILLIIAAIMIIAVCAVAVAAGVGGGGVYVPILVLAGGFTTHEATALSQALVCGGSFAAFLLNCRRTKSGASQSDSDLLDVGLIILLGPVQLSGACLGVQLHRSLPGWLIAFASAAALVLAGAQLSRRPREQVGVLQDKRIVWADRKKENILCYGVESPSPLEKDQLADTATSALKLGETTPSKAMHLMSLTFKNTSGYDDSVGGLPLRNKRIASGAEKMVSIARTIVSTRLCEGDSESLLHVFSSTGPTIVKLAAPIRHNGIYGTASLVADATGGVRPGVLLHSRNCIGPIKSVLLLGAPMPLPETLKTLCNAAQDPSPARRADSTATLLPTLSSGTFSIAAEPAVAPSADFERVRKQLWIVLVTVALMNVVFIIMRDRLAVRCSFFYWVLVFGSCALPAIISIFLRPRVRRLSSLASPPVTTPPVVTIGFQIQAYFAGTVAGIVGVGGGVILGPMLLSRGVSPKAASAANGAVVFIGSSAALVNFAISGACDPWWASSLFLLCFMVSAAGKLLMDLKGQRKAANFVIGALFVMIFTSLAAVLVCAFLDLKERGLEGFQALC